MNTLFAFQTKYAIQNVVLKITDAKRYALISTMLVLIYISVNKCMLSYKTLSVSTFMMFKQQKNSPEENNKTKLIGLMAVCMEHIICDALIALLIFDFLST
jgi:hypothetical protein